MQEWHCAGVAMCGSCGVQMLWCVEVAVCGSFGVQELRCVGVSLWESRCVQVPVCGGCGVWGGVVWLVSVWGFVMCIDLNCDQKSNR